MRKNAIASCAFLVLTLTAASGADKTVTNKELGFEITFPEQWSVRDKSRTPKRYAILLETDVVAGASGVASITVNVVSVDEGTTLKTFVDAQTVFKDSRITTERADAKVGGASACKVTITLAEMTRLKLERYFVVFGTRGYTIDVSFDKADSAVYSKEIDAILKSFKFVDAK